MMNYEFKLDLMRDWDDGPLLGTMILALNFVEGGAGYSLIFVAIVDS